MLECLGRLGSQPNTTIPATCHSEGGKGEAPPNQTDPPQVMSPNLSQTLHQDSAPVRHPPPVDTHVQSVDHQHKKEETSESKPQQELFDVKEEPESPGLREDGTARSSQPSQLPQERPSDPASNVYYQDTSQGTNEAPWSYVMNELRSVQYSFELLRSRIDGIEANADAGGLREGQDNLSTRIRRFEESISVHQVNDFLNRIVRLETSVGHGQIGESRRDCRVRLNQLETGLTNLENRMRTQDC